MSVSPPLSSGPKPGDPRSEGGCASGVSTTCGPRRHNADSFAVYECKEHGALALAVADGVGDCPEAVWTARIAAAHAVRIAVHGGPQAGIAAARDVLRALPREEVADAAMVVATLVPPAAPGRVTVAWVGDCRAYTVSAGRLRELTVDQTFAQELRARGIESGPRWEHVLTNSVRDTSDDGIGGPITTMAERLALTSDGIHKVVPIEDIRGCLVGTQGVVCSASRLTSAAARAGTTDNATALVVDLLP